MADEAGHIALQVGQAPDTDLERQIAEMKRKWQELQQALASTSSTTTSSSSSSSKSSSSLDTNPDTSPTSPQQQRHHQHHRTVNTRRSSARRPSPPSSGTSPSLKEATTPHLLVEGKDQEADPEANINNVDHHRHHQQQRNHENQSEEDDDNDDEEEDESEGDVDGNDSDIDSDDDKKKRRKKRSGGVSAGGGKRRRMSYSYNVDDRKAWRKRQVGIDGLTDEERWTQRMSELEAFKERFGHVNVPQKWHENQKLANWLKNVRQRWTHVANYLTPDKEQILAELGVKKCEPLDIIIAKAKGRGGGSGGGGGKKRKRSRASSSSSSSSTSGSADDDLASSDGGEAEASSSSGEATQVKKIRTPAGSSKDEGRKDGDVEEDEDVGHLTKRRRSAPEPREIEKVKEEGEQVRGLRGDEPRGQPEQQDVGPRRSGRKRKPLFDLEHLDLVQRQQLLDHQRKATRSTTTTRRRSGGGAATRSTEASPLPPDGNDQ